MPPLPPLDPDNTARNYIRYTSRNVEHTLTLRFQSGVGLAAQQAVTQNVANFMLPCMWEGDEIIGAEYSAIGSNIRFPLDGFTVGPGTAVIVDQSDVAATAKVSMAGKGTDGRLVTVNFFTLQAHGLTDTRINLAALPSYWANWFVAVRDGFGGFRPTTISGSTPTWHTYLNSQHNAYWEEQMRTV